MARPNRRLATTAPALLLAVLGLGCVTQWSNASITAVRAPVVSGEPIATYLVVGRWSVRAENANQRQEMLDLAKDSDSIRAALSGGLFRFVDSPTDADLLLSVDLEIAGQEWVWSAAGAEVVTLVGVPSGHLKIEAAGTLDLYTRGGRMLRRFNVDTTQTHTLGVYYGGEHRAAPYDATLSQVFSEFLDDSSQHRAELVKAAAESGPWPGLEHPVAKPMIVRGLEIPRTQVVAAAPIRATVHAAPRPPADQKRVALVVGNGAYSHARALPNPPRDAGAVARALESLNFEVTYVEDADSDALRRAIRSFGATLEGVDLSLFYYAGHAVQVDGVNYLLPIDARLARESDLHLDAIPVDVLLGEMERGSTARVLVLDACRDNPFTQRLAAALPATRSASLSRGLAIASRPSIGTLVAYATSPNQTAEDGGGAHSPYTEALLRRLPEPGVEIGRMFRKVREDVIEATRNRQVPWENSSLVGDGIFLAGE